MLISAVYLYLTPQLPDIQSLKQIELQIPLRIYTEDGQLISEFGEQRRHPLEYKNIPLDFIHALTSAEDDQFFSHNGVDLKGLTRAAIQLIKTGKKKSGGSTITMQVAKNYYLSSAKTFSRKFTEILLALKIEQELSKEEILELYLNKIYLGKRAYGLEAAAKVYYGTSVTDLKLPQLAMLAGLPQAPSAANPINDPKRAKERRNYVLSRMLTLGFINQKQFDDASSSPVIARYHGLEPEVNAPYVAEMVRQKLFSQYGSDIYRLGFRVYTTINGRAQNQANESLQAGLLKYDRDHGYRNTTPDNSHTVSNLKIVDTDLVSSWPQPLSEEYDIDWPNTLDEWQGTLNTLGNYGLIHAAIVAEVQDSGALIVTGQKQFAWLPFSGLEWAKPFISVNRVGKAPLKTSDILKNGQQIWISSNPKDGIQLAQIPEAEGALIAIDPKQGAIKSLVGGFSYGLNKYNRVTQADRQPGSAFKPFIYSAALANGFTPASIINDAPVVFEDAGLENTWRPENSTGKFYGPTRLREALYKSQNLVSIRILKQIGARTAINYITPFGIPNEKLNKDLSLALGASAITPLELATGYTVLANGGFRVEPHFIQRIELGSDNELIYSATPKIACSECQDKSTFSQDNPTASPTSLEADSIQYADRVMDERTHYLINNMLQDVIQRGTGRRALALNRTDLAGKTGTTNDQKDAWFSGYSRDLVTSIWIGFDQPRTLGRWAFGGNTALPIWVDFMRVALSDKPQRSFSQPDGIVNVRIDPETGLLARPGQPNAIFELFKQEQLPAASATINSPEIDDEKDGAPQMLF